jgi:hypothetical protein
MRLWILILCTSFWIAPAHASEWRFRVFLDGRVIGEHQFILSGTDDEHELRSEAHFDVHVLFLDAYRYRHQADERWKSHCLESLTSRTETNGRLQTVSAAERDGRFVVEAAQRTAPLESCVMSFAYWDPQILHAHHLLNSQTGEWFPVTVVAAGQERTEVRGKSVLTQHYRIQGPRLDIDLWYADGNWVGLESVVDGGHRLRYQLL